jgi:flagellar biosynthesis protein FlhF
MIVKKFYGTNTRDALRQVRDALGPDALILANRQIAGGGVEIMAVSDADVATLTNTGNPAKAGARAASTPAAPAGNARSQNIQRTYALPEEDDASADDAFIAAISQPAIATAATAPKTEPRPFVAPRPEPAASVRPEPELKPQPPSAKNAARKFSLNRYWPLAPPPWSARCWSAACCTTSRTFCRWWTRSPNPPRASACWRR